MNIDKDGLASLLERVHEAKGPDRELDQAIDVWLWRSNRKHHGEREVLPQFSASIDASLALVERLLPGWPQQWAEILREAMDNLWAEHAPEMPLAQLPRYVILALLSALKEVR